MRFDQLLRQAKERLEAINLLERQTAVEYWAAGKVLVQLRQQAASEKKLWQDVCRKLGLEKTRWNRCKLLAETYKTKSQLQGLTLLEALEKAGAGQRQKQAKKKGNRKPGDTGLRIYNPDGTTQRHSGKPENLPELSVVGTPKGAKARRDDPTEPISDEELEALTEFVEFIAKLPKKPPTTLAKLIGERLLRALGAFGDGEQFKEVEDKFLAALRVMEATKCLEK